MTKKIDSIPLINKKEVLEKLLPFVNNSSINKIILCIRNNILNIIEDLNELFTIIVYENSGNKHVFEHYTLFFYCEEDNAWIEKGRKEKETIIYVKDIAAIEIDSSSFVYPLSKDEFISRCDFRYIKKEEVDKVWSYYVDFLYNNMSSLNTERFRIFSLPWYLQFCLSEYDLEKFEKYKRVFFDLSSWKREDLLAYHYKTFSYLFVREENKIVVYYSNMMILKIGIVLNSREECMTDTERIIQETEELLKELEYNVNKLKETVNASLINRSN